MREEKQQAKGGREIVEEAGGWKREIQVQNTTTVHIPSIATPQQALQYHYNHPDKHPTILTPPTS